MPHKIPVSVLVVIHTPDLHVLVMERADHPGFWQSVTGSCDALDEPLADTARREVLEETGIDTALHRLTTWAWQRGLELPALSVTRPSLEDVYLDLVATAAVPEQQRAGLQATS